MIKATNNSKHYNREPYEDVDNTLVQWDQSHEKSNDRLDTKLQYELLEFVSRSSNLIFWISISFGVLDYKVYRYNNILRVSTIIVRYALGTCLDSFHILISLSPSLVLHDCKECLHLKMLLTIYSPLVSQYRLEIKLLFTAFRGIFR